jgi:hypothetical protein
VTFTRLQTADPDLVDELRAASPTAQRRAARAAAETAVQHTGVNSPILDLVLPRLGDATPDTNLRTQVAALVEELDERAWAIQDQVEAGAQTQHDYLTAFAAARAAAAVLAALDTDPEQAALESAYEAQAATADITPVHDAVHAALA